MNTHSPNKLHIYTDTIEAEAQSHDKALLRYYSGFAEKSFKIIMAMFVLRSPFDFFENQPHLLCRRRPLKIVQCCSEKSQSCRGLEVVKNDSGNFEVQLDMKNFEPQEIGVKVIGREVTIEANSEKNTENSFESQRFFRKFNIP